MIPIKKTSKNNNNNNKKLITSFLPSWQKVYKKNILN